MHWVEHCMGYPSVMKLPIKVLYMIGDVHSVHLELLHDQRNHSLPIHPIQTLIGAQMGYTGTVYYFNPQSPSYFQVVTCQSMPSLPPRLYSLISSHRLQLYHMTGLASFHVQAFHPPLLYISLASVQNVLHLVEQWVVSKPQEQIQQQMFLEHLSRRQTT